jgi:hypothetical protein
VCGTLFVLSGDESNASGREEVQSVHEGRTHYTENIGDTLCNQSFNEGLRMSLCRTKVYLAVTHLDSGSDAAREVSRPSLKRLRE